MADKSLQSMQDSISYEIGMKLRDLEENQRLMKERILLIGQNLIEFQEKNLQDIIELKKTVNESKSDLKRIKEMVESFSDEIAKSARKEEVAILSRQIKMFEPLKFARIEDVENIVNEKLNKHSKLNNYEKEDNLSNRLPSTSHDFWRGKV